MKITKEQELLLGLLPGEARLLEVLSEHRLRIHELVSTLKQPRSTIVHTVKRLHKRGWLTYKTRGSTREWTIAPNKKIEHALTDLSQQEKGYNTFMFAGSRMGDILRINPAPHVEFAVYQGADNLRQVAYRVTKLNRTKRIYATCSSKTGKAIVDSLSEEAVVDINKGFTKTEALDIGIVSEHYFVQALQAKNINWLKSFEGRAHSMHFLPSGEFEESTQQLIFDGSVYFIDWDNEVAMEVKSPDIVTMHTKMFQALQQRGRKIDMHAHIRELLNRL